MPDVIEIEPISGPLNGSIRPPGSKSITNRVLLIASLAEGSSILKGVLASDDTRVMIESLNRLGIDVVHDQTAQVVQVVGGDHHFPNSDTNLEIENSGTTIRFLTAALGIAGGKHRLDGIHRMRERPIGPLVDGLKSLGANVVAESPNQCPPIQIDSSRLSGGVVTIGGNLSSQYLSGLMMAAPLARDGLAIRIEGPLVSKPYVAMTIEVMKSFGVEVTATSDMDRFKISGDQRYRGIEYAIEPDASAASYFWAAAAICGGRAEVLGLTANALQGDVGFVRCLEQMGCRIECQENSITVEGPAQVGIDIDMGDVSDTVQTLAAVALFVSGTTRIRNVAHNRIKETDRIGNLAIELRKLGATVEEFDDGLAITPNRLGGAEIETYNDHRMAMSLALVGLKQPGVKILDPGCVSKTYPNYFDDLREFCNATKQPE